jgi:transcriptional regulator with XRE-family HTH domain
MFLAAPLILGPMNEPKKSRLDDEQQADAQRLRALWDQYRAAGGLKQDEFAAEHGLKSQSNMGHYLQGRQPLNLRSATAFAKGMKVPIEAISPSIAAEVEEASPILRAASSTPKLPASLLELNGAEGQLIMFFRGLPPEEQAHVLSDLNNAFNAHTSKIPTVADPYAKIGTPAPSPVHVVAKKMNRENTQTVKYSHTDTNENESNSGMREWLTKEKDDASGHSDSDESAKPRRERAKGR